LQFDVAAFLGYLEPLVMVVDRDRELLLCELLADDVEIEELLDFLGLGKLVADRGSDHVVGDDLVADIHALIADVDRGTGDELFHFVLALGAERATQDVFVVSFHLEPSSPVGRPATPS